ncbi:MAG: hypothetical protein ACRDSK_13585 [Actinophytocola sp.]|uniref:hypothetical protein n=1 Tax=Actinophytocola sp. TaxID=1872138 RepID=UPI003D6A17AE
MTDTTDQTAGTPGATGGTTDTPPPGQQTGQAPPADAKPTGQTKDTPPWGSDENFNPERAWNLIQNLRSDLDKHKAKSTDSETKYQGTLDAISKALGLKDDAPDPTKLTEQLTASQAEAAAAAIELQVYRTAQRLGANADRLLDSRSFVEEIDNLDVDPNESKAFTAAVEQQIKAAMERDSSLQATPPASTPAGNGRPVESLRPGAAPGESGQAADPDAWLRKMAGRT